MASGTCFCVITNGGEIENECLGAHCNRIPNFTHANVDVAGDSHPDKTCVHKAAGFCASPLATNKVDETLDCIVQVADRSLHEEVIGSIISQVVESDGQVVELESSPKSVENLEEFMEPVEGKEEPVIETFEFASVVEGKEEPVVETTSVVEVQEFRVDGSEVESLVEAKEEPLVEPTTSVIEASDYVDETGGPLDCILSNGVQVVHEEVIGSIVPQSVCIDAQGVELESIPIPVENLEAKEVMEPVVESISVVEVQEFREPVVEASEAELLVEAKEVTEPIVDTFESTSVGEPVVEASEAESLVEAKEVREPTVVSSSVIELQEFMEPVVDASEAESHVEAKELVFETTSVVEVQESREPVAEAESLVEVKEEPVDETFESSSVVEAQEFREPVVEASESVVETQEVRESGGAMAMPEVVVSQTSVALEADGSKLPQVEEVKSEGKPELIFNGQVDDIEEPHLVSRSVDDYEEKRNITEIGNHESPVLLVSKSDRSINDPQMEIHLSEDFEDNQVPHSVDLAQLEAETVLDPALGEDQGSKPVEVCKPTFEHQKDTPEIATISDPTMNEIKHSEAEDVREYVDEEVEDCASPITENVPTFSTDYSTNPKECVCPHFKIVFGSFDPCPLPCPHLCQKAPTLWRNDVELELIDVFIEPTNGSAPRYHDVDSHQNESLADFNSEFEAQLSPTFDILAGSVLNSSEEVEDELSGDGVTYDEATSVENFLIIDGVQSDEIPTILPDSTDEHDVGDVDTEVISRPYNLMKIPRYENDKYSEKVEDEFSGDGFTCDKATSDGIESDEMPTTLLETSISDTTDGQDIVNTDLPESSITDTTDGQDADTEVISRPFDLMEISRYEDDECSEKISNAQLQVNEKTQQRDVIRAEIQNTKTNRHALWERYEAAKADERTARRSVKLKRQEIDSLQSAINRAKNEISIEDVDNRIYAMEYKLQHETLPLKEEKEFIREIKRLKHLQKELDSNMGSLDEVHYALYLKDQNEDHLKKLKKELETLKDTVLKAEATKILAGQRYDEESERLTELQAQFKAANDIRQEAYGHLTRLREQIYAKSGGAGKAVVLSGSATVDDKGEEKKDLLAEELRIKAAKEQRRLKAQEKRLRKKMRKPTPIVAPLLKRRIQPWMLIVLGFASLFLLGNTIQAFFPSLKH